MCRKKEGEEETESALIASRQVCEGTDSHFRSFGSKDICQRGDPFRRKDLKVLELKAFNMGFLVRKKESL